MRNVLQLVSSCVENEVDGRNIKSTFELSYVYLDIGGSFKFWDNVEKPQKMMNVVCLLIGIFEFENAMMADTYVTFVIIRVCMKIRCPFSFKEISTLDASLICQHMLICCPIHAVAFRTDSRY